MRGHNVKREKEVMETEKNDNFLALLSKQFSSKTRCWARPSSGLAWIHTLQPLLLKVYKAAMTDATFLKQVQDVTALGLLIRSARRGNAVVVEMPARSARRYVNSVLWRVAPKCYKSTSHSPVNCLPCNCADLPD